MKQLPKTRRVSITIFGMLVLLILSSCAKTVGSNDFDPTIFKNNQSNVTLGFDLRNDSTPIAGLVINASRSASPRLKTVALPFASAEVSAAKELFSTSGSYDETTLINFYLMETTTSTYGIGIIPIFQSPQNEYHDPSDIKNSVAFISDGLVRIFVYKYPEEDPYRKEWLNEINTITNTEIDAIGIALPTDQRGEEIRNTGSTNIPKPKFENSFVKFYPAKSVIAKEKAIEIKYRLPGNEKQNFFFKYGVRLFIVLLPPGLQLGLKIANTPQQRKKQKYRLLYYSLLAIQVILLGVLLIIAFIDPNESAIDGVMTVFISLVSVLIAGIAARSEKK
jgi:hypothetical protein